MEYTPPKYGPTPPHLVRYVLLGSDDAGIYPSLDQVPRIPHPQDPLFPVLIVCTNSRDADALMILDPYFRAFNPRTVRELLENLELIKIGSFAYKLVFGQSKYYPAQRCLRPRLMRIVWVDWADAYPNVNGDKRASFCRRESLKDALINLMAAVPAQPRLPPPETLNTMQVQSVILDDLNQFMGKLTLRNSGRTIPADDDEPEVDVGSLQIASSSSHASSASTGVPRAPDSALRAPNVPDNAPRAPRAPETAPSAPSAPSATADIHTASWMEARAKRGAIASARTQQTQPTESEHPQTSTAVQKTPRSNSKKTSSSPTKKTSSSPTKRTVRIAGGDAGATSGTASSHASASTVASPAALTTLSRSMFGAASDSRNAATGRDEAGSATPAQSRAAWSTSIKEPRRTAEPFLVVDVEADDGVLPLPLPFPTVVVHSLGLVIDRFLDGFNHSAKFLECLYDARANASNFNEFFAPLAGLLHEPQAQWFWDFIEYPANPPTRRRLAALGPRDVM
ncbi:hypothetical protein EIP86_002546 [Pleurotus ostreatoroseus]|nr:hypothetical protein EIP86_002546 [Pleurotus ostreatoroseus]